MNTNTVKTIKLGLATLIMATAFLLGSTVSGTAWASTESVSTVDQMSNSGLMEKTISKDSLLAREREPGDIRKGRGRAQDRFLALIKRDDNKGRDRGRTGLMEETISTDSLMAREREPGDIMKGRGRAQDRFLA